MKIQTWKRILAAGVITLVALAIPAESADTKAFKLRDLFKKPKPAAKAKPAETKTTDKADAAVSAEKKEQPEKVAADKSSTTTASSSSSSKPAASAASVSSIVKEMSTSDRLKSLTDQLDIADSDPDALLRSARERFRKMKGDDTKKPVETAKKSEKASKVAAAESKTKADAKLAQKTVPSTKVSTAAAPPVVSEEKAVTSAAVMTSSRVVDPSRPPSLVPVTAVVAAGAITSREVPAENLRTTLAANDVPIPKPLVAAKQKKKKKSAPAAMEITSDQVEMDNEKHTTTFIGNVNLDHPTFHLKSDRLVIYMHEEGVESDAPFRTAVATGARVIVERANDKGGKDVGQSRKVVYDALTGDLVLSMGPPQLQSGGSLVRTKSDDATITLKKDGNHSVKDSAKAGTKIIIPMNNKKGGTGKGPNLMPSKLGDISKRK